MSELTARELINLVSKTVHVKDVCMNIGATPLLEKLAELEQAEDEGRLHVLPCKVGDKVWALRRYHDCIIAREGIVSKMRYSSDMRLVIIVQNVARGYWGEKIFPTREAAEAALKKMQGGQDDAE